MQNLLSANKFFLNVLETEKAFLNPDKDLYTFTFTFNGLKINYHIKWKVYTEDISTKLNRANAKIRSEKGIATIRGGNVLILNLIYYFSMDQVSIA